MPKKKEPTEFSIPATSPGLSNPDIHRIALSIAENEFNPDDARRLLEQFVFEAYRHTTSGGISRELITYLRDAFQAHLENGQPLLATLGLEKTKGRPKANAQQLIQWALFILERRLEGVTHDEAVHLACKQFSKSQTPISDAWAKHRNEALRDLTLKRRREGVVPLFAPEEYAVLRKTFDDIQIWDPMSSPV
jgi:hypothetical protein